MLVIATPINGILESSNRIYSIVKYETTIRPSKRGVYAYYYPGVSQFVYSHV
jgi:hypothetical protein